MKNKALKIIIAIILIALLGAGYIAYQLYNGIFTPNIFVKNDKSEDFLFIPSNANLDSVIAISSHTFEIKDTSMLRWVAIKKNYDSHIYPGRYLITDKMSYNSFVNLLRSGNQSQIKYTIKFHRKIDEAVIKAAENLECSTEDLMSLFDDNKFLSNYGLNRETAIAIFMPNTYYFNWNTSAEGFVERMKSEFDKFWNEERMQKAKKLGLSPIEIVTLASIVERECKYADEMPRVAGVYLNRLKKGMLLQADPTVVYASGDFSLRRVLNVHTQIDSPYNTYKYKGLPPGPICTPESTTIDKVLNPESHKYYYFCAKDDFSGYHAFATNLSEHNRNATNFQRALNSKKIYK